jgi:hypothetical protein
VSLVDKLKESALSKIESKIDEDSERAAIKKKFNALIDLIDEERDLPGPDALTVPAIKMIFAAGLDQLAAVLDDGEI